MNFPSLIIGWQEWVELPDLDVPAIRAKIDTGARTSSIHAYKIKEFKKNNKDYVRFEVHPVQRNKLVKRVCELPIVDRRVVRSSGGECEERPVVRTNIVLGNETWEIELNLTNRDYMGFRMLLGRQALAKKVLINSGVTYLHGKMSEIQAKNKYLK